MSPQPLRVGNANLERLPRRERENLRQRGEILETALKLFSEKGYHNVSMQQIAKEAEFGVGTIYKFFSNKQDLYKILIMDTAERWQRAVIQVLEQERNPCRAITRYITVQRELFFDNLPVVRLYYSETRGACFNIEAGFDQDLLKLRDERIEKLMSVFETGIKESVFRDLDPYHMALALHGIIDAFLFRMMEDPARFRKRDELSDAAGIFLGGIMNK
ncbi:MAG: TetR/AcrR family transcriptional regulator [Desulfomonile tiedjei]|nr:TetR/AcrR family transcriptional regulator [Desulfomonile tiedjei]